MGERAVVWSAVPQDLMDQQEAHGCEGGCEVTSLFGVEKPAAGTWLGKGL